MTPADYTAVRCGMNVSGAIIRGDIDAGIGLENVQMVELAEWLASQGRSRDEVKMLRIDELAELGCCCFCSVLYIGNEKFLSEHPVETAKFMKAVKKATDYVLSSPKEAYEEYVRVKSVMGTELNRKIFERSFAYFSKDLKNVQRDWQKVTKYGKRLGVLSPDFEPNYTNSYLDWELEPESSDPTGDQKKMAVLQQQVAKDGGYHRVGGALQA